MLRGHGMGIRFRQPAGIQRTDRCPALSELKIFNDLTQTGCASSSASSHSLKRCVKSSVSYRHVLRLLRRSVNSCGEEFLYWYLKPEHTDSVAAVGEL